MTIWVNEQIDPSGMIHACIACCDQDQANACHESYEHNLTETQKASGWVAIILIQQRQFSGVAENCLLTLRLLWWTRKSVANWPQDLVNLA